MKLTLYLSLLICILVFVCSPTFAQQNRWILIGQNSDGTLFYLDNTFRQVSGNTVRVWSKNIFRDRSYLISLVEWRCNAKKYFFVDTAIYNLNGIFVRKDKGTEWLNVIPDSSSEAMYKVVCDNLSDKSSQLTPSNKKIAEIIVRKANVRASPSTNSGIVEQANLGEKFFLADEQPTNGWYQIILSGTSETAWIHGNNIKLIEVSNKSNNKKQKVKRKN